MRGLLLAFLAPTSSGSTGGMRARFTKTPVFKKDTGKKTVSTV